MAYINPIKTTHSQAHAAETCQLTDKNGLRDLQGENAQISMSIDEVGVSNLILPFMIKTRIGVQNIVATIDAFCSLKSNERGSHMSRIVRILNDYANLIITPKNIIEITEKLRQNLDSDNAYLKLTFTLFKKKAAPVTKIYSYVNYKCWIAATNDSITLGTSTLITSLCPVSKSISHASAHNQRGEVKVEIKPNNDTVSFEDIIDIIEESSSSELYGVIKREDEKYVTEKAYANPRIVEDIVRLIATKLTTNNNIKSWSVSCENFESIHTHNAYAKITSRKI